MKNYLAQNRKMKRSKRRIFNFGIPAYRSASSFVTCPMAGTCATGCYARQGAYIWTNVTQAYEKRLALTKSKDFPAVITAEIARRKIEYVRIHDAGDFYSPLYFAKWLEIARHNPTVQFYAYSKMVLMIKNFQNQNVVPDNLTIIFSEGGKQDSAITPEDRHSRVFANDKALAMAMAGYTNATRDDSRAFLGSAKVGLVYHGHSSRAWTTA